MTKREKLARLAGLGVTLLPLSPGQVVTQPMELPPATVAAVFVTDAVRGLDAGPARDNTLGKARLESVAPGS